MRDKRSPKARNTARTKIPTVACSPPKSVPHGRASRLRYQGFPHKPQPLPGQWQLLGESTSTMQKPRARHRGTSSSVHLLLVPISLCSGLSNGVEDTVLPLSPLVSKGAGFFSHRQREISVLTLAVSACPRGQAGSVHPPQEQPSTGWVPCAWSPAAALSLRRAEPLHPPDASGRRGDL